MHHLPSFIQTLAPIINQYGYLAVGGLVFLEDFGIPVPGETVLITAAVFAGLGHLNILIVLLVGILGAISGDSIGFSIGYFGGHTLIDKYGKYIFLTHEKYIKIEKLFIEGLRQINGIIAGLSEMPFKKFILFNSLGAILWVSLWSGIGYFAANNISTILKYQTYFTIVIIALLVSFVIYKLLIRRKSNL